MILHWVCRMLVRTKYTLQRVQRLKVSRGDSYDRFWDRVHLLALLWVSVTKDFQDTSFFFVHLNWRRVLGI